MTLSSYRIPFLAPYFVEIQRKSFLNLLNHGLVYELSKRNFILDPYKRFFLTFYPEYYQLSLPDYTPKQAILKSKTYASKLYVPLKLTTYKTKQSKLQWTVIGNLPLMTKRGHFIVNGTARVIVNQMVRSPGVYYNQAFDQKKRKTYYADLIPDRGAWLRLEVDRKKRVWVRLKKSPKIPILFFLQAAGITEEIMTQTTKYFYFLENSMYATLEKYGHPEGTKAALLELYSLVYPRKKLSEITLKNAKKFLFRKFFNFKTYDLSRLGRIQLNKKFQLSASPTTYVLTSQDLLGATDYLIKLVEHGGAVLDDIDHLKNRRVKASGELIQNQLGTGFIRLEKFIREKIKDPDVSILRVISSKPVNGALREFFGSSPLSQFMDQTNPLAELTHKRRVSSLGPGGISRETAGMAIRGIHPTHYGRVCPIETPEGPNAGLVNSLTTFAKINDHGFIETPFYSVYQGQLQKYRGVNFFSAAQEEYITSAPGDLKTDYFYNLPSTSIPVKAKGEFTKLSKNEVDYMSVSPIQMISIATSLIPFLEHDDANRALMGSNMQRQAVPLLLPEKAVVGTGLESRVISDSGHGIQAKKSGFVSYVSGKNIKIENFASIRKIKTYGFTKTKSTIFLNKKKDYLVSMNFKIYKKILGKNFLYLTELIVHKNLANFQDKKVNKAWFGFEELSLLHKDFILAPYFLNKKISSFSNENNTSKIQLKQNSSKKNNANLDILFQVNKARVKKICVLKNTVKDNLNLLNYNKTKFFSSEKIQKNIQQNLQDIRFLVHHQLVIREQYVSKINFLNFSEKALKQYFTILTKISFFNVAFNKKFIIECSNLLNTQTFNKKKNLKHIFFYKSSAWNNGCIKNFILIRPNKKICQFLHHSPYVTSTIQIVNDTSNFRKANNTFSPNVNNTFFIRKKFEEKFYFDTSSFAPSFADSFINSIATVRSQSEKSSLSQHLTLKNKNFKKIKPKNLFCHHSAFNVFQNLNQITNSFNFSTCTTLSSISSTKIVVNNINDMYAKLHKYYLYKLSSLANSQKLKKKIVNKFTNFYYIKNKIKNLTFSHQFYFLHENRNYSLQSYQRSNQNTCMYQKPIVYEGEWVQKGDLLADGAASVQGELALGKTLLVAYMPWEGYNFEDAILISQRLIYDDLYTSIHIERYEIEICETPYGLEQITSFIPYVHKNTKLNLDDQGIIKLGSWVNPGDILVGKVTPIRAKPKQLSGYERLLSDILNPTKSSTTRDTLVSDIPLRDTSLKVPKHGAGKVVHIELLENENIPLGVSFHGPGKVHIYIAEKRKIQVGDKMSGRHGNKGIISKIAPREDMPYLPDGTAVDMVLNPLGVPSRMNVGQIFECILGLAGKQLNEQFKINCFDEVNGPEASRSLTYSKLFEAKLKTGKKWLFNPNYPGKMKLFDGRTGEPFDQTVTVGQPYMLKLVHLVDEKIHARSTGPYSLVTQQPLRGRSKHGGQRLGEMEVWALEGFGAAYTLQELLTVKSDDIKGREQVMESIVRKKIIHLGTPESFKVLLSELQALCLDIGVYSINNAGIRKKIDMMQLS